MSRCLTVFLFALVAHNVMAQFPILPLDSLVDLPGRWHNEVALGSSLDYNANSVYNELTYALWSGAYLDRDLRERSLDAMNSKNSAGYEFKGWVSWTGSPGLFGHVHLEPMIKAANHEVMGTRFTSDAFELAFFGNAGFEGERADLGPSSHTRMQYQSLGAGVQDARTGSFVRVDVILGQSISTTDITWAGVYTGEDGRVLRASILGEYYLSDTAGSELGRNNGMGASLSGSWTKALQRMPGTRVSASLEDFGAIRWNDNAVHIAKDTVIEFMGWNVSNILDLDEVLIGEEQIIDTLGLQYSTGAFTTLTPFRVSFSVDRDFGDGWYAGLELAQRYLPGFVPQITGSGSRRLGSRVMIGASLSFGGFGGLRLGLAGRMRIGDRVWFDLGTPHLPGFLLGTTRGYGLSGGMTVGF